MKIDKLAGLIMFLSISYSIVIFGLILILIVIMPIIYMVPIDFVKYVLGISFIIYLVDLFSFGLFRKIKYISYLFYPIFKLYDFISLRFLYKKSLLVYSTNINKIKTTLFIILFMVVVFISTYISIQEPLHYPNLFDKRDYRFSLAENPYIYDFYEDDNTNSPVRIPSKIIKDNYLELTIEYWAFQDKIIELIDKPDDKKLFSDIIEISIDDSIYNNIEWYPFKKTKNRILGIKAMIPIDNLKKGKHLLNIHYPKEIKDKFTEFESSYYQKEILFWKNND